MDFAPARVAQMPQTQRLHYRQAVPVPDDLREQCHIYLDEEIYVSALALLTDIVTSGTSHPTCPDKPVMAPLPYHIEIVSAFLIHPQYTNHAIPNGNKDLGSRPITLLRDVLAVLGPVQANLREAFSLTVDQNFRPSRRTRNTADLEDRSSGSDTDSGPKSLTLTVANTGRIRHCARDFWHMVGWAFNCSVRYPRRWPYWKVWLDYMLDVLERDWVEREWQDVEDERLGGRAESSGHEHEFQMLPQSLLGSYLSGAANRSSAMKRVVRCAFSDGSTESLREFPEVFPHETRELTPEPGGKRQGGEAAMHETFSDAPDDEAEVTSEACELRDPSSAPPPGGKMPGDEWLGGTESMALRQRVINMLMIQLSRAAAMLPDSSAGSKEVYREEICVCTWSLPLPAFSLFLSASASSQLDAGVWVGLSQMLLRRSLPASAPGPESVAGLFDVELSQGRLERCFLPFPASSGTVSDNARVSLVVEGMLRWLGSRGECAYRRRLREAVDQGIRARETPLHGDGRRKDRGIRREDGETIWLRASGRRLRHQLGWMRRPGVRM
ncbi:hypothetical protein QTJ16_002656 [Diplocarpon rosae]|uniref:Uncharacterized protein n=1 Tax=Diplocarpon rosae TaxID=946125 RepID=A0AAD9T499_9HELO|nr:hypothetical protein QTJ16_002656 [Diplocarpon rosae]